MPDRHQVAAIAARIVSPTNQADLAKTVGGALYKCEDALSRARDGLRLGRPPESWAPYVLDQLGRVRAGAIAAILAVEKAMTDAEAQVEELETAELADDGLAELAEAAAAMSPIIVLDADEVLNAEPGAEFTSARLATDEDCRRMLGIGEAASADVAIGKDQDQKRAISLDGKGAAKTGPGDDDEDDEDDEDLDDTVLLWEAPPKGGAA